MKLLSFLFISCFLITSCANSEEEYQKAADAEEAGSSFIRASLDGNYKKARFYLYHDSSNTNLTLLERWKNDYNKLSQEDKINYKEASIIPLTIQPENDSSVNYTFTNSFKKNDTTTIKVVRIRGEWLIDFKDLH